AISASGDISVVKNRGYKMKNIPEIPLVVDDKIQTIKKTNQIYSILGELGFHEELNRVKNSKKVRAGKGKRRGRKYKMKKGILMIIKEDFGIVKSSRNIPGIEIIDVENLSIDHLAPGGMAGRLTIWTQSAINELNNKFDEMI
ncbi:MAG: 50S ribosomal protein L4, partial [Promethearchaeota archaeon]